jgi:hypothetical protein
LGYAEVDPLEAMKDGRQPKPGDLFFHTRGGNGKTIRDVTPSSATDGWVIVGPREHSDPNCGIVVAVEGLRMYGGTTAYVLTMNGPFARYMTSYDDLILSWDGEEM